MKNKKILFLTQLPPPIHGVSVMNGYIKSSVAINKKYDTDFINTSSSESLSELGLVSLEKYMKFVKLLGAVLRKLFTVRYDICYITLSPTTIAFWKDSLLLLLAKLFIKNRIIHLHGRGAKIEIEKNRWKKYIYQYVFKNTITVVLSERLKADIRDFVHEKNIRVLPNGIPRIDKDRIQVSTAKQKRPILLFLSNLIITKGVFVFVDIIEKLKEKGHVFEAWIVGKEGDVSFEGLNKYISQKSMSDIVKVKGAKYGTEKNSIIVSSSMLIYPSYFDAFPLVLLEAIQFGLPVVTTDIGGIPDMVENGRTGFVLNCNDVDGFVDRVSYLLKNPEIMNKMSQHAQAEFASKYTLEIFESSLIAIFEESLL